MVICKAITLARLNRAVRDRVRMPQEGYTLAGVLVLIAILSIFMAVSVPIWERIKQRENEEELIFRGREYVEAIARYHQKYNSFPPDVKTLYDMKFLRRQYKDPMTKSGEWKLLHPDSLVQTGAAGEINQPGAKNPTDESEKNQQKPGDQPDANSSSDQTVDQSLGSKKQSKDDEEEPEASPDDKEISLGPIVGVVSRSKKSSLLIYNGQSAYNKWIFAYVPQQQPPQQQQPPGKPGRDKGGKNPKPPSKPPTKPGASGTDQNDQQQN